MMRTRPDYARLFTPEERDVAQRFDRLSEPSKALYVRLFQRKGPWFRADGMLVYDEVGTGTPLWIRRRNAAATADAAAAAAAASFVVDDEGRDQSTASALPPSTPFAPAVAERVTRPPAHRATYVTACPGGSESAEAESVPTMRESQADSAGAQERGTTETGQGLGGSLQPADPAAMAVTVAAQGEAAAEAAAIAAAAADSVAFTARELTVLHEEIQSALRELVGAGFLNALPDDVGRTGPGLEVALAAVECCVRLPELKALLKTTGGNKKPGGGRKSFASGRTVKATGRKQKTAVGTGAGAEAAGGGRRGIVKEIRRRHAGQQTLWGVKSPLVGEIERLISASVEALGVDIAAARSGGGSGGGSGANGGTGLRGKISRRHWLVSVVGYPQLVFKRALRLMYLTCHTSALSSGRVGAASVRGAGVAGALSSWSPGLSAAFGKTRCVWCWRVHGMRTASRVLLAVCTF